jgi:hypothetical protein
VFASDFLRTRHTAEALCQALGQDVDQITYDVRLRERYFGDFNGTSSDNYPLVWNEDESSMHHTFRNVERYIQDLTFFDLELALYVCGAQCCFCIESSCFVNFRAQSFEHW